MRHPWNANIHYDRRLADLAGAPGRVLDVGCGDGFLSAELARRGHGVVALDRDAPVLERARTRWPGAAVDWRCGDLMTADLAPGSFDAVLSNAVLHHLPDTAAALGRLGALVRPGGVLGIVGFARNSPRDWPRVLVGQAVLTVHNAVRHKWEHTEPQHWPPPNTYREVRDIARRTLPGSDFRHLVYGRFLIRWRRPA